MSRQARPPTRHTALHCAQQHTPKPIGPPKPRGTLNAATPDAQTYPTHRAHCQALCPLRTVPHLLEACRRQAHRARGGQRNTYPNTQNPAHTCPWTQDRLAAKHGRAGL